MGLSYDRSVAGGTGADSRRIGGGLVSRWLGRSRWAWFTAGAGSPGAGRGSGGTAAGAGGASGTGAGAAGASGVGAHDFGGRGRSLWTADSWLNVAGESRAYRASAPGRHQRRH